MTRKDVLRVCFGEEINGAHRLLAVRERIRRRSHVSREYTGVLTGATLESFLLAICESEGTGVLQRRAATGMTLWMVGSQLCLSARYRERDTGLRP